MATGRHAFRPAHIHFIVTAPGHRDLTTHIFVAGSEYIESDTVFAVKKSLVVDFEEVDRRRPWRRSGTSARSRSATPTSTSSCSRAPKFKDRIIRTSACFAVRRPRYTPERAARAAASLRAALRPPQQHRGNGLSPQTTARPGQRATPPPGRRRWSGTRTRSPREQPRGPHPGAGQQLRRHLAEAELQQRRGHPEPAEVGAPEGGVQRGGELGVRDRVRGGQVVRAAPLVRAGAVEQEADRPDLVGQRDPAHHLVPVTEARQHAEAGGQRQPAEHAAARAEHEPAAQVDDADARRAGRVGGRLPVVHDAREERLARRGALGDLAAAGVAVPADRGGGDERLRPWLGGGQPGLASAVASAAVARTRLARISAL